MGCPGTMLWTTAVCTSPKLWIEQDPRKVNFKKPQLLLFLRINDPFLQTSCHVCSDTSHTDPTQTE